MLDGLLGRGYSSKCKSFIKLSRTRIDAIKRKRNAMQKYLKKDIAELLANGLDINAYGRADGLSIELNLSSCYDSVDQFCECIPKHLSAMQKQSECPEECREAVSSVMFAAARFADLPELRDLRDTFTERYGKNLEAYANKEFVENLASKPPTAEKKLRLMREIAQEFSIRWDSRAFEQKIVNSHVPAQDQQPKRHGSFSDTKTGENKSYNSRDNIPPKRENQDVSSNGRRGLSDDKYMMHGNKEKTTLDREKFNVTSNGRRELSNDGYRLRSESEQTFENDTKDVLHRRTQEVADESYKQQKGSERNILERDSQHTDDGVKPWKHRDHTTWNRENREQEHTDDGFKPQKGRDDTVLKGDNLETSYHGRRKHDNGHELHNGSNDVVSRREKKEIYSYREQDYPAMKQKMKMDGKEEIPFAGNNPKAPYKVSNLPEATSKGPESTKPLPPPPYLKPNGSNYTPRYATLDQANKVPSDLLNSERSERAQTGVDPVDYDEGRVVRPARETGRDNVDHEDDLVSDRKPKPKSVRRRHMKPPAAQDYGDNNEANESVKRNPSARRREHTRQGLQHALDDGRKPKDEERMMDKLLMHYSKKPTSFEPVKVKGGLVNPPPGCRDSIDAGERQGRRRKDVGRTDADLVPPPSRATSLPPEPITPTEAQRAPSRATSFQPEMLNAGGHVHPRLPDYDDLAARFAALRGR